MLIFYYFHFAVFCSLYATLLEQTCDPFLGLQLEQLRTTHLQYVFMCALNNVVSQNISLIICIHSAVSSTLDMVM